MMSSRNVTNTEVYYTFSLTKSRPKETFMSNVQPLAQLYQLSMLFTADGLLEKSLQVIISIHYAIF